MKVKDTDTVYAAGYVVALGISILLSSCASTRPPTQTIAETRTAVKQAEQIGAQDFAPLEIREARKKLEKAEALVKIKKYEEAERLAVEARVDAELAQMKALSEKAQRTLQALREGIKALKEEIENNQQ